MLVSVCLCTRVQCSQRPEEDVRLPGAIVTGSCKLSVLRACNQSFSPLEGQSMLYTTTKSSLQPSCKANKPTYMCSGDRIRATGPTRQALDLVGHLLPIVLH